MMVRRYVVKDMPEAVTLIRQDLGKDAVILSTKRIRLKKWMGLWQPRRIEVMAAVGSDVPVRTTASQFRDVARELAKVTGSAQLQENPAAEAAQPAETGTLLGSEKADTGAKPAIRTLDKTDAKIATPVAITQAVVDGGQAAVATLEPHAPVVSVADGAGERDAPTTEHLAVLYSEVQSLKQLLKGNSDTVSNPSPIMEHLREHGLSAERAREFADWLASEAAAPVLVAGGEWRASLKEELLRRLADVVEARPIAPTSRIVAFVGPTGVGKTTTIAKLAALHVLAGERSVGLITTDTFRIAAVEQLRTYASILNVPLEVLRDAADAPRIMERLADKDLILVDTAGRNYRDDESVGEVQRLLHAMPVDETILVLSLTSKLADLKRMADTFAALPMDKFLFTKLDETTTFGAAVELVLSHQKPLSYISTGQNVPDDLEMASLTSLVEAITGEAV